MRSKKNWIPIPLNESKEPDGFLLVDVPDGLCPVVLAPLSGGEWDVLRMVSPYGVCSSSMVTCKTLASAKRWVSRYYRKGCRVG